MIYAWKSLPYFMHFGYGDNRPIEIGTIYEVGYPAIVCDWGFHASIKAIDMLTWAQSDIVARVKCSGHIDFGADKLACTKIQCTHIFNARAAFSKYANFETYLPFAFREAKAYAYRNHLRDEDRLVRLLRKDMRCSQKNK
ncbi:MAG TPA: hypothetical protein PK366_05175 [Fibrobacteraceae bacterium]|nr:hypothetical protein [Fibrobacteraceae bacterium]